MTLLAVPSLSTRARLLNSHSLLSGPILYWMSRDQRAEANWALLEAQQIAQQLHTFVHVVFCLRTNLEQYSGTRRMLDFMIAGLTETEKSLFNFNIPFSFLLGNPETEIPSFCHSQKASMLVIDFNPLKINVLWKQSLIKSLKIPLIEVDAHNIVPAWVVSNKREYGAYTIRPKIRSLLHTFLTPITKLEKQSPHTLKHFTRVNWSTIQKSVRVRENITLPPHRSAGYHAASKILNSFIHNNLNKYPVARNDPTLNSQSDLSAYIHFGHISTQEIALDVNQSFAPEDAKNTFLEELITRKELSDNFCLYTPEYDSYSAFPLWAQNTLASHAQDKRTYIYTYHQLENALTHDALWNAAQLQMTKQGKMHGYMRMYWAKKILEWTNSPQEALEYAIKLNDLYELDGRDPNGYAGIAWSIGGVHDRPWFDRPIYGTIRYMNVHGASSKFDVNTYIRNVTSI